MSAPPKTFKESVLELNRNAKTWEEVESFITVSAKNMKKSYGVLLKRFENWLKETNESKAPHAIEGPPLVDEEPVECRGVYVEIEEPLEEQRLYDSLGEDSLEEPIQTHKGASWYEPKTKFDVKNLNGKCLCGCEYKPEEGNLFYRGHGRKLKMLYLKFLKAQKDLHSLPLETQDYLKTRWSGLTV